MFFHSKRPSALTRIASIMGNSSSDLGELSEEAKICAHRFDMDELHVLRETFKDLAHRSSGKTIDKDTFLQYIRLPGLFGERLFHVFNKSHSGTLDLEEFICGLAICGRGSRDEKIRFIFNMYDVSGNGAVCKAELATLLNHVPTSVFRVNSAMPSEAGSEGAESPSEYSSNEDVDESSKATSAEEELDMFTNNEMVEAAFADCDLTHQGKLSYEEFKMWVERTPEITNYLTSILPYSQDKSQPLGDKRRSLPFRCRPSVSSQSLVSFTENQSHPSCSSPTSFDMNQTPHDEGEETARRLLLQASEQTKNPLVKEHISKALEALQLAAHPPADLPLRPMVDKEGYLWKKGKALHLWHQRYYLLSGNCMYYYAHETDARPRGVIFLTGSIVEPLQHDEEHELRGWFGFEVVNSAHEEQRRILYTRSREERDNWLHLLQHAAEVVPIEEDYVIGKELGRGRFSHVCECVQKTTGKHFAVKIIDKNSIEPEEKELLRTEIAVLKLVHHPHIIQLQAVYESRTNMYIVMELLQGGELFDRIVGRPRFSEAEAAKVLRPLIESVAYLHDLGIVHRDIKPENILCGENLEDLKIADFGLSKLLLPRETMRMPCGTLSYVAPEVLTMSGYGKEADIWSIGVIMFLLLCGKLPFDGRDREEIIANTIKGELTFKNPNVWNDLSEEARDLILGLLNKVPAKRYTARQALRHPWLAKFAPVHHHHHHHHHHHSHNSHHTHNGSVTSIDMNEVARHRHHHHRSPRQSNVSPSKSAEVDHPMSANLKPPVLVITGSNEREESK